MKIGEILSIAYNTLKSAGIDTYIIDSQLLLQKVLNRDKLFIILNRDFEISREEEEEFLKILELRKNKMPVKYILGECEFMGMNFSVKEGVLIPRADTEILVEEVIKEIKCNNYTEVCDVCCGSGAIGVAIAEFVKKSKIYCYDISDVAIQVTKCNINKFKLDDRVKVVKSDLLEEAINKNRTFDLVVSNPPYIRREVIPTLMEDVKNYEPYIALCGGEDGLDFYRKIAEQSLKILDKRGTLAFEIGHDQGEDVKKILDYNGFKNIRCMKDLAGLDRVIIGSKE